MAAHILTGLKSVVRDTLNNQVTWSHLQAALDFSTWTEDLDLDDYRELQATVDSQDQDRLFAWAVDTWSKYKEQWYALGQPATREDWNRAKFDDEFTGGSPSARDSEVNNE